MLGADKGEEDAVDGLRSERCSDVLFVQVKETVPAALAALLNALERGLQNVLIVTVIPFAVQSILHVANVVSAGRTAAVVTDHAAQFELVVWIRGGTLFDVVGLSADLARLDAK